MRHPEFLRRRYREILGCTGVIFRIISLVMLSPLLCLPFYTEELAISWGFVTPGLALFVIGWALSRICLSKESFNLTYQEGPVIIVLSWLAALIAGAVPFFIIPKLDGVQALFEATSGWTTTGLSVLDVTAAPHLVLFYRSVLQFAGGAGFAIIMLSALVGPAGTALGAAEGRETQLVPNVKRSAKLVISMYAAYAAVGILSFRAAGMDWFDAVNHAFTAVSTGGFSTRPESFGYWDSPGIEAVAIVLMLLGSTNFLTAYMLLKGKFKFIPRNGELRLEVVVLLVSVTVFFLGVTKNLYPLLDKAVRVSVFEAVSALSTTGFSTVRYETWNGVGWMIMIILMIIGGGTGSTAGGIKQYRIYVLYRGLLWEFRRRILPQRVVTEPDVWFGEERRFVSDEDFRRVSLFVFFYLAVFVSGAMILSSYGFSLREGLFEFASTVGTVGLSVDITNPDAPSGMLWTQVIGMFLGRLEFFTVVVGVIKLARDVRAMVS
jgi:trk system potassium uptake protein TrkH